MNAITAKQSNGATQIQAPSDIINLSKSLNADTQAALNTFTRNTKQRAAVVTLLTTNYRTVKRDALVASGISKALTPKFLHALNVTSGALWISNLLKGELTDNPIPAASGIASHKAIKYFVKNAAAIVGAVNAEKEAKKNKASPVETIATDEAGGGDTDTAPDTAPVIANDADTVYALFSLLDNAQRELFVAKLNAETVPVKQKKAA